MQLTDTLAQQLVIEPAGVRDWMPICQIVAHSFPLAVEADLGHWLCHERPWFQVARLGTQVLGFMHAQPRPDTRTLWINMLAVAQPHRQQGVAHRLIQRAEQVCLDWQCQHIGLQCLTTNAPALHLYQQHGYGRLAESTTGRGQQVVAHRKTLPAANDARDRPAPPLQPDTLLQRRLYRLLYLGWFRRHSPLPRFVV